MQLNWRDWIPLVIPLAALPGIMFATTFILSDSGVPSNFDKKRALCDQAVDALLHSNEQVEVTRAGIIIDRLNCGIGRRLP